MSLFKASLMIVNLTPIFFANPDYLARIFHQPLWPKLNEIRCTVAVRTPAVFLPVGHGFVVPIAAVHITSYILYSVHRTFSSSHDVGILIYDANHHNIGNSFQILKWLPVFSAYYFLSTTLICMLSNAIGYIKLSLNKGDIKVLKFSLSLSLYIYIYIYIRVVLRPALWSNKRQHGIYVTICIHFLDRRLCEVGAVRREIRIVRLWGLNSSM